MGLKYLFSALLTDGQIYEQTEDDVSKTNPLKSAFYDICQETEKGNAPKIFALSNESAVYLINLDSECPYGEINAAKFRLSAKPVKDVRLIYFRKRSEMFTPNFEGMSSQTIFCLGYQGNDIQTGENVQYILEIE